MTTTYADRVALLSLAAVSQNTVLDSTGDTWIWDRAIWVNQNTGEKRTKYAIANTRSHLTVLGEIPDPRPRRNGRLTRVRMCRECGGPVPTRPDASHLHGETLKAHLVALPWRRKE